MDAVRCKRDKGAFWQLVAPELHVFGERADAAARRGREHAQGFMEDGVEVWQLAQVRSRRRPRLRPRCCVQQACFV